MNENRYSFHVRIAKARKMSSVSYKGVPFKTVYRNFNEWDLDHLPEIVHRRDHSVLFKLPITTRSVQPPKPFIESGGPKWDSNHVKLPCAPQNEYKTESASNSSKSIQTTRWEIIQTALLREINSTKDFEKAVLTYNPKYAKVWKFRALHTLFEEMDENDAVSFFKQTLPEIIRLALQLPDIVKCSIPLLKRGQNKSISLSQEQIACLLANAFLCTFPRRNSEARNSEFSSYPTINFAELFSTPGNEEKVKCICNYFRRVVSKRPTGVVTFARRLVPESQLPDWEECQVTFDDTLLHISSAGTIEDDGNGLLQVDFANKYIGGGVLDYGCVQEEIRFMINPELLCSRLFTEVLQDNECMTIVGCEQFNKYTGYASTFEWAGDYVDKTPLDSCRRRRCAIVAIDAIYFRVKHAQYEEDKIRRELNKAYVGFKHDLPTAAPAIATGNWGCGAFKGDKNLKSLLQLMACCVTKRPLVYYTFGDEELCQELFWFFEHLVEEKVTIAQLWSCLARCSEKSSYTHLYEFLVDCLKTKNDPKPSTNGQSSKSANRSNVTPAPKAIAKPKRKQIDSQETSTLVDELMKDTDASLDWDFGSDDQYDVEEAMELARAAERSVSKKKPQPLKIEITKKSPENDELPAKTIQQFFTKQSNSMENQEKRPRSSLLVDSLDASFYKKSPPKMQRKKEDEKEIIQVDDIDKNETKNTCDSETSDSESDLLVFHDAESGDDKVDTDQNDNASKSDNELKTAEANTPLKVRQTNIGDFYAKSSNTSSSKEESQTSIIDLDSQSSASQMESENMEVDQSNDDEFESAINSETLQLKSLHVASDADQISQDIDSKVE
ncbi:poly(ADP-ribose) glycohydrolase isoform X2 [Contarinia nasturtii]|uniref:poly(ADP-ribose) glycohydrolase isoform X2 n=1 Tax=Contarinia nasturtii TaxID=265458 RepID=UPI0012D3F6F8|nr:poly(ADP-ribose) glycohydrolase isoform X2 [Contarinia nasturtii]